MDVVDDCIEFWFLHSGRIRGGSDSSSGDADDTKNLRVRMDDTDWLPGHEKCMIFWPLTSLLRPLLHDFPAAAVCTKM